MDEEIVSDIDTHMGGKRGIRSEEDEITGGELFFFYGLSHVKLLPRTAGESLPDETVDLLYICRAIESDGAVAAELIGKMQHLFCKKNEALLDTELR